MTETHLRFDGWLRTDDRFEPIPGWETEQPIQKPTGDGPYRLVVRDAEGDSLASITPQTTRTTTCAPTTTPALERSRITGYVPLVTGAESVALLEDDRVLVERPLAPEPPAVEITEFDVDGASYQVRWSGEHPGLEELRSEDATEEMRDEERTGDESGLTYHVGCLTDGVVVPLALDVAGHEHEGSLESVPGDEEARLLVLATDGLRSATARTEPFALADPGPELTIQEPQAESAVPADQPLSLVGQVVDSHGRALSETGLTWQVDGETVASGERSALSEPLEPGEHTITLSYDGPEVGGDGQEALDEPLQSQVTVSVHPRTERQQWYREVMPDDRLPGAEQNRE